VRDEFSDTSLALNWNFIRTPHQKWYELEKDQLLIQARNSAINERGQPSFIGRRQQHHYCSATTAMRFDPKLVNDKAGLVVFQNEKNYYLLALTNKPDGLFIILEKSSAEGPREIAGTAIDLSNDQPILLKIEARGKYYDFYFANDPDRWNLLAKDVDATLLSTHEAGGFVGAYFGMYAYSNQEHTE
jgi:alpha-N-arabinofuranosidase